MTEENIELSIRSALIPVFYQTFRCLAQDCWDSCCVGWDIYFDKKDYLRLRRLDAPGDLQERLERGVRRIRGEENVGGKKYGRFDVKGNSDACPFLDQDGLCAIQKACGHEVLPFVCKTYPRFTSYSIAAKEYSLSPSCEGVLQQLWQLPDGIEFIEDPLPKTEQRHITIPRGESLALYFAPVRSLFIDILQNRALSLTERMLYLGITVQRLQKEDLAGFDPDRWADQAASMADAGMIREMAADIVGNRNMYLLQNLNVLGRIAMKERNWPAEISAVLEARQETETVSKGDDGMNAKIQFKTVFSAKAYEDALAQFQAAFSGYEYFFENLMVASALYMQFPDLSSRELLWKSYVSLCNLYSLFRFVSVLGCKGNATKERLFHMIVMASRSTLHNRDLFQGFQEDLFEHDSSTLAHMAILLRWD